LLGKKKSQNNDDAKIPNDKPKIVYFFLVIEVWGMLAKRNQ